MTDTAYLIIDFAARVIYNNPARWCGGTGRRPGLKIPFWQQSTGSIPVTSTNHFYFRAQNPRRKNDPSEDEPFFCVYYPCIINTNQHP